MTDHVLDSSAVLAYLFDEPGGDRVRIAFQQGATSAANWSEIAQKTIHRRLDWTHTSALLFGRGIRIEPVTVADAEASATMWTTGSGLSLADRLCIALGDRLDARVLTADTAWGSDGRIEQIR